MRVCTYLSSVAAGEHTRESRQVCLSDQQIPAFSRKLQTAYCLSSLTHFPFMAGYRNLQTSVSSGYLLILSVNGKMSFYQQAINNILAILLYFSLSCKTTLLMLSCDSTESAKFIHGTPSPVKLVYYKNSDDQAMSVPPKNHRVRGRAPSHNNKSGESTQRVSGDLDISRTTAIRNLHEVCKTIGNVWIWPRVNNVLKCV